MSSGKPTPQCWFCKHFDAESYKKGWTILRCAAFPHNIPDEIWYSGYDHKQPHDNDQGIQYEQLDIETIQIRLEKFSEETIKQMLHRTMLALIYAAPHTDDKEDGS